MWRRLLVILFFVSFYSFSQSIEYLDWNDINTKITFLSDSIKDEKYSFSSIRNDTTVIIESFIGKGGDYDLESLKYDNKYKYLQYRKNLTKRDTCIHFLQMNDNYFVPVPCYSIDLVRNFLKGDYKMALENALLEYEYAISVNDSDLAYRAKSHISSLEIGWGDKLSGIKEKKKQLKFILSNNYEKSNLTLKRNRTTDRYLSINYAIISAYLKLNQFNLAKKHIDSGYFYYKKYKLNTNEINKLTKSSAIYYFRTGEYVTALDSLNKFISLDEKDDFYSQSSSAVYKGLILNKLNRQDEAIAQIKYADSLYQITDDEFEELTEGYKLLVDHYKETGDETSQLLYLNKLLKLDSVITSNYITTNAAITKNYTIPELEREKQEAISRLEVKNQQAGWGLWGLGGGLLVALGIGGYYFKTQRQYKKRFKAVVEVSKTIKEETPVDTSLPSKTQENPLDPELVKRLDQAIKTFEEEERFTATKITQKSLAEELNTNSAYLSRYINQYKGKNFAQYLIGLRINYVIQRLQTDKVLRSYTVDAIAEECGFGNTKSFTRAFKAATGINPSYFIRNVDKNLNKDD